MASLCWRLVTSLFGMDWKSHLSVVEIIKVSYQALYEVDAFLPVKRVSAHWRFGSGLVKTFLNIRLKKQAPVFPGLCL